MTLEEEKMQSGNELKEEEKREERKGHGHGDGDNSNLPRSKSRSRSRSRSRIKTLIASLYTPLKSVTKELKNALIITLAQSYNKLKKDEQCEERKGPSHVDGDNTSLGRSRSRIWSRSRIKTLIGSLYTPLKCVGKELKNGLKTSAQIYYYTSTSYYHFLLHLLGSTSPLPPISIAEISELGLNVNGGPGNLADHDHCSTCKEELQSSQEMGMMLPCGHKFHGHSISNLLENNNCCPLCILILHDANAMMSSNQNQREQC
ncbi:hypothetical protein SUGI_0072830 [Cryptomeria japonica]|nr:hypothetical protein SUGI_0072830 [Cryptomeria japonica]